MEGFFKKNIESILFFGLIIVSFFIVMLAKPYDGNSDGFERYMNVQTLTNGWTFYDGKNEQKVSLPVRMNSDSQGDGTSISAALPEKVEDDYAICFRTSHSRVQVLIDGVEVYQYRWTDEVPLGSSPGSLWNIVDLSPKYSGKTITIKTDSPYDMYEGLFRTVTYGDKTSIIMYLQKETRIMLILSCIPIVLGIILIIAAFFAGKEFSKRPFAYVGIFLAVVGIWETTETGYLQFLKFDMYTVQIVNLLTFGFIPLLVIMALKYTNFLKYYFKRLFYINVIIYAVYVALQLLEISDMHQTLWLIQLSMVIDSIFIFWDTKRYYDEQEDKGSFIYIMITYSMVFFAIIIDLYRIYIYPDSYNGYATRIAMVLFIVLMAVIIVQRSLAAERKNIERETMINMAYTDILTGIKNRRCFEEDAEKLADAKKSFNIVAIDMNNLKMINDELGHKFGDEALIKVANALRIFENYGEECYRMGGDEFEVICKKMDIDDIDRVCEQINKKLAKTEYFPGIPLSIAYGSFRFSANMDTEVNKVMARADKKMYEKKQQMKEMGYATRQG
jgi:diguanylate cyclase (GGDEF)-like protein